MSTMSRDDQEPKVEEELNCMTRLDDSCQDVTITESIDKPIQSSQRFDDLKTDLERFQMIYKSVGVNIVVKYNNDKHTCYHPDCVSLILFEVGDGVNGRDKIDGYNGFATHLEFDENGKFIKQEIYE